MGDERQTHDYAMKLLIEEVRSVSKAVEKLNDKQHEMNTVLTENTVIVKEHERRSLAIEDWAENFEGRFVELIKDIVKVDNKIGDVKKEVSFVKDEIEPIKQHVEKVSRIVNFINGIPVVLKVIVMVFGIISALYGAFVFIYNLMPRK